jgi:SAM-dependent methyltransferase
MATATVPLIDEPALAAYEEMADVYDAFTSAYDYERWLAAIEALGVEHGLRGSDVLDVACGTGKSFMPLLERGYSVTACDLSPRMVERARAKSGGSARVEVADMRRLPDLGRFDLATCLDDALNYLLTDADLGAAIDGMARALRPGGILVFDCNSLATYRSAFAQTFVSEDDGIFFCWNGEAEPDLAPGGRAVATLEAFVAGEHGWRRRSIRHLQRHHPRALVERVCCAAGLDLVEVLGQRPGVLLDAEPDELRHTKLLYLARRRAGRD